jgi:multiple sugar transport system ATP-binding protein
MARIELQNIVKNFDEVTALNGLDLSIEEGEFLVILGPSGAGKTTTLKVIAGIEKPSSGRLLVDGRDVSGISPAERDTTMVFETYALYPHMTVADNMASPLKGRSARLDPAEIQARVLKVARMLRMESYLERFPSELSGGQKQRVAMGRAMVREPQIFLLDEPLSHVDAKIREELRRELHQLRHTIKSTVVYVTHDYVEALSLGQRIAIMNQGRIEQIGSPRQVYFQPDNLFVATHLGQPEINLFEGVAKVNMSTVGITLSTMNFDFDLPAEFFSDPQLDSKEIVVGIRPQFVHLSAAPQNGDGFKAKVVIRENLKSELDLVLKAEQAEFTVLGKPEQDIQEGQEVFVHLPPEHLLIFNKDSGQRIDYQPTVS